MTENKKNSLGLVVGDEVLIPAKVTGFSDSWGEYIELETGDGDGLEFDLESLDKLNLTISKKVPPPPGTIVKKKDGAYGKGDKFIVGEPRKNGDIWLHRINGDGSVSKDKYYWDTWVAGWAEVVG